MPHPIESYKDPETGMLDSPNLDGFTVAKKVALLKLIEDNPHWQGISEACKQVGVDHATFYRHRERDTVFRKKCEELKQFFVYKVEGVLAHQALDPKKTIDRIAYLRAYMPERYARGEIQQHPIELTINLGNGPAKVASPILDADVIPAPAQSVTNTTENRIEKTA